ncbi:MAG TPA: hypothetical protein VLH40_05005 [Atribacteraceae bacterium]|nr:hypothetical protein [Atribacteraceae bacterium]
MTQSNKAKIFSFRQASTSFLFHNAGSLKQITYPPDNISGISLYQPLVAHEQNIDRTMSYFMKIMFTETLFQLSLNTVSPDCQSASSQKACPHIIF